MHLRFNFDACPMHSPFGFVHLTHQNLSARALFCLNSLAKVNTQLLIYKYSTCTSRGVARRGRSQKPSPLEPTNENDILHRGLWRAAILSPGSEAPPSLAAPHFEQSGYTPVLKLNITRKHSLVINPRTSKAAYWSTSCDTFEGCQPTSNTYWSCLKAGLSQLISTPVSQFLKWAAWSKIRRVLKIFQRILTVRPYHNGLIDPHHAWLCQKTK